MTGQRNPGDADPGAPVRRACGPAADVCHLVAQWWPFCPFRVEGLGFRV